MGYPPIQSAFLQTDAIVSHGQTGWDEVLDDAYQAWKNAIASMERLLSDYCAADPPEDVQGAPAEPAIAPTKGLILSGPTPVLYQPQLAVHFQSCLWTSHRWPHGLNQLLPSDTQDIHHTALQANNIIPVAEDDPLRCEQFCLVLTRDFCWVITLSHSRQTPTPFFATSFNPETVQAVLGILTERVQQHRPTQTHLFQQWLQGFAPVAPVYIWPMIFSQQVLVQSAKFETPSQIVKLEPEPTAEPEPDADLTPAPRPQAIHSIAADLEAEETGTVGREAKHDIELLQAIAHEIRTPLATIQTLTKLLIRRKDLPAEVIDRLELIQQECTQQIDRFSLIFRAIELTTTPSASLNHSLTSMSLQQLFNQRMERWESILERRSLEFDVQIPKDLPAIAIRDPMMLDQVLTGLIEQLSQTLPLQSKMSLRITLAGDQLKLQLRSSLPEDHPNHYSSKSMLKAVGQLLMLQPETGNLSLSLPATKQIFNFLGGKLTVRQSPPRGEILTMFLPLESIPSSMFL